MKFNKLTHLSIIVVFAIVFIVIYLYYTISDVKKIHNEVQKLSKDLETMNHSIASIMSAFLPIVQPQKLSPQQTHSTCAMPQQSPQVALVTQATSTPQVLETQEEDALSEVSQELRNIMQGAEDDIEEVVEPSTPVNVDITSISNHIESPTVEHEVQEELDSANVESSDSTENVDIGSLTVEQLKNTSYDAIKKYCKDNNISPKGTKEVLIYRIKNL